MALTVTSGTGYLKLADSVTGANEYVLLKNMFGFTTTATKIYISGYDAFGAAKYHKVFDITDWETYNSLAPVMATIEADILSKATA